MTPQFQERHQDYVINSTMDSRLASIAPGQLITNIELQMDVDAPFLLRGRAYRVQYNTAASHTQVGIQNVSLRFSGPTQDFRSAVPVPQGLQMAYGGQSAAWKPVYPEIYYPANSTMLVDVLNTSPSATLTNLSLYFRGVKLFPWGVNPGYTYPSKCALANWVYPIVQPSTTNPYGTIQTLAVTDPRLLLTWQNQPDTDFVLRALQAGPSYAPFGFEVFITLRDENRKAFSNQPVHFEVLCGPSTGNYQTGASGSIGAIGTGNSAPGIIYPEIYVPAQHLLYYDITRSDGSITGAASIPNFPVNLIGCKVYQR
jgi:hypothetical protein